MKDDLLIIGGLLLSVLTYFAGVLRTKHFHEKDDKENRINRVVDKYVKASQSRQNNGLNGLLQAGIANLKSDTEIREACERIVNYNEKAPYSQIGEYYNQVDLYSFFSESKKRGYNFLTSGNAKELASELIKKP
jgi:hypothetical protein